MNSASSIPATIHREQPATAASGWLFLVIVVVLIALGLFTIISGVRDESVAMAVAGVLIAIAAMVTCGGFFTLQPNESAVLTLFGAYRGTTRQNGFLWTNPFYRKQKISLRIRNLNSEKLKVNDKRGNPVEIAVVIVWRIQDTAQAVFDIDSYETFIRIQSETCVRHIASCYYYDDGEPNELTLRGGGVGVAAALAKELQERLDRAGIGIEEARLAHLAYAPEIAQTMLRRQQAEAVIAARQKIVYGAVGMVDMALRELSEKGVVKLDEERKAAMVSNLLVVLCSESQAQPVLNAGTLYG
jgi:regulator of protease activity HflC (stomatin/prohibitin superfamily)